MTPKKVLIKAATKTWTNFLKALKRKTVGGNKNQLLNNFNFARN